MAEQIDIIYNLNSDQVQNDAAKVDKAIEKNSTTYIEVGDDVKAIIAAQKLALKDLEKQFKELEKATRKAAPGAAQNEMKNQLSSLRMEINSEKQTLQDLTSAQKDNEKATVSLRTQMANLRSEMANLEEGTEDYTKAQQKLGQVQDKYGDINKQGQVLANDERNYKATTEAIQGLSGATSATVGVSALLGVSQENLAAIQTRLQAVMAISIGMQQMAQVLNKDSYFSLILMAKVKALLTAATTKLSVALGVSTVVAKALMVTLTLGLSAAITGIIWLIDKMTTASAEASEKQQKLKEQNEAWGRSVAEGATKQIMSYTRLRDEYNKLGGNIKAKEKFIKDAKKQFDEMAVSVDSITKAEDFFNRNTQAIISAFMARAKAAAMAKLAEEQYVIAFSKKTEIDAILPESQRPTAMDWEKHTQSPLPVDAEAKGRLDAWADKAHKLLPLTKEANEAMKKGDDFINKGLEFTREAENVFSKFIIKPESVGGKKEVQDYGDQLVKNAKERQFAIAQAEVDALVEGSQKKLKQLDLDHEREMLRITEQEVEVLALINKNRKNKGEKPLAVLSDTISSEFTTLKDISANKRDRGRGIIALGEAEAKRKNYQKQLEDYEAFTRDYIAKVDQFKQREKDMKASGASKEQIAEVSDVQAGMLAQMEEQMRAKSEIFSSFATSVVDMGLEELFRMLDKAEESLSAAKTEGGSDQDVGDLKAQVAMLQERILALSDKKGEKVTGDPTKKWKNTLSVMNDVKQLTSDVIGNFDGLDDTTKIVLDSAMNIATGVINMIIGITTLATSSVVATTSVAQTASASIKAVESASVILAIISAAIQIIMAIANVLKSVFNDDKKIEKEIEKMQTKIDALEKSYEVLGRAIEDAYSKNASRLIENQNVMLAKQKELIEQQKEAEKSKKTPDTKALDEYDKKTDEINKKIEENKKKATDAIFGSDLKSAIDNFASAYVDAWSGGEDRAKSQKDVVKKMIQDIVSEIIKSNISGTVARLRETLKNAIMDGVISTTEEAAIDKLQQEIFDRSERDAKAYEKWLKDDDMQNDKSLAGQIKGSVATEASVSELGGLFRSQTDSLLRIDGKLETGISRLIDIYTKQAEIEANTRRTANNTDGLIDSLNMATQEIKRVVENTSKDNGSYGNQ